MNAVPKKYIEPVHLGGKRMRLKVRGLFRSHDICSELETFLYTQRPDVERVQANPLTGSVTIILIFALDSEHACSLQKEIDDWMRRRVRRELGFIDRIDADFLRPETDFDTLVSHLTASPKKGLSPEKVKALRSHYGKNRLRPPPRARDREIFARQINNLPTLILGGSAFLSLVTGGIIDAALVAFVLGVNSWIGYKTEKEADAIIAGLDQGDKTRVLVLRSGRFTRVWSTQLVPGDVVHLQRGSVPADIRLMTVNRLTVDESILTGESHPVEKSIDFRDDPDAILPSNIVFRDTIVTGGDAKGIVIATGMHTRVGALQASLNTASRPTTPLQKELEELSTQTLKIAAAMCALAIPLGLLRGMGWRSLVKTSVSLAIAAIPESLPTVGIVTMAFGARRLQRQNILVKDLKSVETLGGINTICLDKTGTVTENKMTVKEVRTETTVWRSDEPMPPITPDLRELLLVATFCTEHRLGSQATSSTEAALQNLVRSFPLDTASESAKRTLEKKEFRTESRPYMSASYKLGDETIWVAVKGSPDHLLNKCRTFLQNGEEKPLTDQVRDQIALTNLRMSKEGMRVLGFGFSVHRDQPFDHLVWLGLVGLSDPTRPGIADLVRQLRKAGIRPVLVTGDQLRTALAVGKDIRLRRHIKAYDLHRLSERRNSSLAKISTKGDVFARVSPSDKLRLIHALQKSGLHVAMTGDGINDGPALKAADIGIAMGKGGTSVARTAANVVVGDDNLETLVAAIRQGRTIRENLKHSIKFLLSTNAGELGSTLGAIAWRGESPFSPHLLLWINFITDVFPALALALEKDAPDVMTQKPNSDPRLLRASDYKEITWDAVIMTAGILSSFIVGHGRHGPTSRSTTMAFATLGIGQMLFARSMRSDRPIWHNHLQKNKALNLTCLAALALTIGSIYTPGLNRILGLAPLNIKDQAIAVSAAVGPWLIIEALKQQRLPSGRS